MTRPGPASMMRSLALFLALIALFASPMAQAAGGGEGGGSQKDKMTKRPRYDAALSGGEIIQLETMWVPILIGGNRRQFIGMTIQLRPHPDRMADACYVTPWVTEALISYFNQHPLTANQRRNLDGKDVQAMLRAVVDKVAQPGVFQGITVLDMPPGELEFGDAELSLICV